MIKMKSVPIIFLIFMFIILTIPAYAADTKKITSVNIQRIYKAKEGELNPDQVSMLLASSVPASSAARISSGVSRMVPSSVFTGRVLCSSEFVSGSAG